MGADTLSQGYLYYFWALDVKMICKKSYTIQNGNYLRSLIEDWVKRPRPGEHNEAENFLLQSQPPVEGTPQIPEVLTWLVPSHVHKHIEPQRHLWYYWLSISATHLDAPLLLPPALSHPHSLTMTRDKTDLHHKYLEYPKMFKAAGIRQEYLVAAPQGLSYWSLQGKSSLLLASVLQRALSSEGWALSRRPGLPLLSQSSEG